MCRLSLSVEVDCRMAYRSKLKVTVFKKVNGKEIFGERFPTPPKYVLVCDRLEEGKEFIVDDSGAMPQGFCPWAWDSIAREVTHLQFNGDFPWYEEKGIAIACCTDGLRPVIFKIERINK